ncbi:MAG: hypothetical protein ABW110_10760 [Steroidobacteraceae bacterium]
MKISVINHTNGQVSDEELQSVIRAINRQIAEDFVTAWGMDASLHLEGRSQTHPEKVEVADMRGDAVLYLWDQVDVPGALGYHARNNQGIPFGFVFTTISQQIGEPWSVTLSHEALELIADPETNLLVMGPHPTQNRVVFHWFEMCDAVQAETYDIDGIAVSNFVLPLYFTGTRSFDEVGARNDFLGRSHSGQTLRSFGINPGGYVGFYDPELQDDDTFSLKGDGLAMRRFADKSQALEARRSVRYRMAIEGGRFRTELKTHTRAAASEGMQSLRQLVKIRSTANGPRLLVKQTPDVRVPATVLAAKSKARRTRSSARARH